MTETPKPETPPPMPQPDPRLDRLEREVERLKIEAHGREESRKTDPATVGGATVRNGAQFPEAPQRKPEPEQAASNPDPAAETSNREAARRQAEEDQRGEGLYSSLKAAQMLEDRARRDVDSIRTRLSLPQNRSRSEVNRSALASAEAMLRLAEGGTREARRAHDDWLQNRAKR
jgi:hypothetical protein